MALSMTRPTKHPKSGVYRVRKVVPKPLRPIIGTGERIICLGTKDPAEARERAPAACQNIKTEFALAQASLGPAQRLTQKEVVAQCGAFYRAFVAEFEDDPGAPIGWEAGEDQLWARLERDGAGDTIGFNPNEIEIKEARRFLAVRGVAADDDSVRRFAVALFETKRRAMATLEGRAMGDYSPDVEAERFPPVEVQATAPQTPDALPAGKLLEAWAAERHPAAATRTKYAGTFRNIARVLGFDDVRRITPEHVLKFKQVRADEDKASKTIRLDILNAGAVCKWAVANHLLKANPFAGMVPRPSSKGELAREPFDDDDARRILIVSRREVGWMRWLPWLLCFTGARISEIVELRRRDVRQEAGVWILDIVPTTARAGKNPTFQRMIPLHPAVIQEGFLAYHAGLAKDPNGPLFPGIKADPRGSRVGPATTLTGRWMRKVVGITDPRKVPNHSWRHRMEDQLRIADVRPEVVDAITGRHNPRNAGAGYGKGFRRMPAAVLKDLCRIPSPLPAPPGHLPGPA